MIKSDTLVDEKSGHYSVNTEIKGESDKIVLELITLMYDVIGELRSKHGGDYSVDDLIKVYKRLEEEIKEASND